MSSIFLRSIGLSTLVFMAGCATAPLAPSPGVMAGPGKTDADFQADVAACSAVAKQAVQGAVSGANTQAIASMAIGMAAGGTAADTAQSGLKNSQAAQATIQQQYDAAYGPCMYSKGDVVPGMTPPPPTPVVATVVVPVVKRDPLVRDVQTSLVHLGYLTGGADGVPGPKTAAAISKFETDKGMTVDGVSSRNLMQALKAAEAAGGTTVASGSNNAGWAAPPPPPAGAAAAPAQ